MKRNVWKRRQRQKRAKRIRRHVRGTPERPRLSIFRSLKHTYAQIIDDEQGRTICSASTQEKAVVEKAEGGKLGNRSAAATLGAIIAERGKDAGIQAVCFDRGPYKYHGRVKALAEAAREGGLKF